VGYGLLYLKEYKNIFDSLIVVIYFGLILLSIGAENTLLVKIRGVLRVVRVIVLVRYL
jgi:hypothetical protein